MSAVKLPTQRFSRAVPAPLRRPNNAVSRARKLLVHCAADSSQHVALAASDVDGVKVARRSALLSSVAALATTAVPVKAKTEDTSPIKVIKAAYAKFAQGDIAGLLDNCTDDIKWSGKYNGVEFEGRNKEDVIKYFTWVDKVHEVKVFKQVKFFADDDGDEVVVFNKVKGLGKLTNKPFNSTLVHFFVINSANKIAVFQEFGDTALENECFPGNPNEI